MKVIINISEEFYEYICDSSTVEPNMRISYMTRIRERISSELIRSIVNGAVVSDDVNKLQEQLRKARKKAKRWKRKYLELRYDLDKAKSMES